MAGTGVGDAHYDAATLTRVGAVKVAAIPISDLGRPAGNLIAATTAACSFELNNA